MKTVEISEVDFVELWGAKAQESGDLFTYEQIKHQDCRKVWSIVEDGGETDNWYAQPGCHVVNVLGYVLTDRPWTGNEQALWFEAFKPPAEGSDGYPDDFADGVNGYLDD